MQNFRSKVIVNAKFKMQNAKLSGRFVPIIDKVVVMRSLALLRKEEGGKEHDRVLWTGQGV